MWQIGGVIALVLLGVAAVVLQILELLFLPFWPGSSGFASVFMGFYSVFVVVLLAAMVWLEMLLVRSRFIPAISFVEQPPTYNEAFAVQRFQASLSGFAIVWGFLAVVAVLFWVLFYAIPKRSGPPGGPMAWRAAVAVTMNLVLSHWSANITVLAVVAVVVAAHAFGVRGVATVPRREARTSRAAWPGRR